MKVSLIAAILFLASVSFSQSPSHPDLSGDWILNLSESKVSKGTSRDELELEARAIKRITQRENQITVSLIHPTTGEVLLSTPFIADGSVRKTDGGESVQTKWDGKKLTARLTWASTNPPSVGSRRADGMVVIGGGAARNELQIEWELLPNGRLVEKEKTTIRIEMQILDKTQIDEHKTEVQKVFDRKKAS